jgi:2'-5' RNA ligase
VPRIFIAIPLPPDVAAAVGRVLPPELGGLRRVDPAILHFTLVFLGQVPEARLADVTAATEAAVTGQAPFAVAVRSVGRFPAHGPPRIVWAGAPEATATLARLGAELRSELEHRGLPFDAKPLQPHITLARVRDEAGRADVEGVEAALRTARLDASFVADALHVMESTLSQRGPRYSSRAEVRLRGRVG